MVKQPKIALTVFDDKRGFNIEFECVPWGHGEYEDQFNPADIFYWLQKATNIGEAESLQRSDIFINEPYGNPPRKIYATNKTDVYYIWDTWSMDLFDLSYSGPKNLGFWFILVIGIFSKVGWTIPSINKNAQTMKESFEKSSLPQKENRIYLKLLMVKNF